MRYLTRTICSPTAVTHVSPCHIFDSDSDDLLVIRSDTIELISVVNGKLVSRLKEPLDEVVIDLCTCRVPGAVRDSVFLALQNQKVTCLDLNTDEMCFKSSALYSFDQVEGRCVAGSMKVDPLGRCICFLAGERQLMVIPLHEDGKAIGDSFVIDVGRELNTVMVHQVAFCFGYFESTVLILHERKPTVTSRLPVRANTCSVSALSINVEQQLAPGIWSVDGLPHDTRKVVPLPEPIGGCLCFSSCGIFFTGQSSKFGQIVNSLYVSGDEFKGHLQFSDIGISLDNCRPLLYSPSELLIVLQDGVIYRAALQTDGRSITRVELERTGRGVVPSSVCKVGKDMVFVGSSCAQSLLLGIERSDDQSGNVSTDKSDAAKKAPLDGFVYKLNVLDSLASIAPINDLSVVSNRDLDRKPSREQFHRMLYSSGRMHGSTAGLLSAGLWPELVAEFRMTGVIGVFGIVGAEKSRPGPLVHSHIVVSKAESTSVFHVGDDLVEVTKKTRFISGSATLLCSSFTDKRGAACTVQVTQDAVRVLSGLSKVDEIRFGGGQRPHRILSAHFSTGYLVLALSDGSLAMLEIVLETIARQSQRKPDRSSSDKHKRQPSVLRSASSFSRPGSRVLSVCLFQKADISAIMSPDSQTSAPLVAVVFDDDTLGLFCVEDTKLVLLWECTGLAAGHRVLASSHGQRRDEDSAHKGRATEGAQTSDVKGERQDDKSLFVVEVVVSGFECRPYIAALLSDGTIVIYEGFSTLLRPGGWPSVRFARRGWETRALLSGSVQGLYAKNQPHIRKLIPFSDVCGRSGIFCASLIVPGSGARKRDRSGQQNAPNHYSRSTCRSSNSSMSCVFWHSRGNVRVEPFAGENGALVSVAPFNNRNCQHGFVYASESGYLRIAYAEPSPDNCQGVRSQEIPLSRTARHVAYHPPSGCFVLNTCERRKADGLSDIEISVLRLMDGTTGETVAEYSFPADEIVLDMQVFPLHGEFQVSGEDDLVRGPKKRKRAFFRNEIRDVIVCGTSKRDGEDAWCRGNIVVLDIVAEAWKLARAGRESETEVETQDEDSKEEGLDRVQGEEEMVEKKEGGKKIVKLAAYLEKGPVTRVVPLDGHVLCAIGNKLLVYELGAEAASLVGRAFIDSQPMCTAIARLNTLILTGDILNGVRLVSWRKAHGRHSLSLVSKDVDFVQTSACEFLVNGSKTDFVTADAQGNLRFFSYDDSDPLTFGGLHLLRTGRIHYGRVFIKAVRIKSRFDHGNSARSLVLLAGRDGSLMVAHSLEEDDYSLLSRLCRLLRGGMQSVTGLCYADLRSSDHSAGLSDEGLSPVVDGDLADRFLELDFAQQARIAALLDSRVADVKALLFGLAYSSLVF